MELASTRSVVFGSFAFLVFWVMATFPKFPGLPIGRTAGAIVGATLMVVFQVDSPDEAYDSINLPILGLLFGTMVVSVYLQRADMFQYLASALSWKCKGGKDLLCRLSFLIAFSSAIFTNDTCCVLFTQFILNLCREKGLPPEPFLLALASSANLGSSATPIGNPQNLVIAMKSKIPFGKFVVGMFPAMLLGVTVNLGLLLAMYWKQLSKVELPESQIKAIDLFEIKKVQMHNRHSSDVEDGRDVKISFDEPDLFQSCRSSGFIEDKSLAHDLEHVGNTNSIYPAPDGNNKQVNGVGLDGKVEMSLQCTNHDNRTFPEEYVSSLQVVRVSVGSKSEREIRSIASPRSPPMCESPPPFFEIHSNNAVKKWRRIIFKPCVYLVTLGMLAALLAGLNLSWSTLSAAIALIVLDFRDAGPSLSKVSYSLLIFFSGMFITVDGFNRTGLPAAFWNAMEPHARINHASGVAILAAVIIFLSNVASNVPTGDIYDFIM